MIKRYPAATVYLAIAALTAVFTVFAAVLGWSAVRVIPWIGAALMALFLCRPQSAIYRVSVCESGWQGLLCVGIVIVITGFACVRPMGEFPLWNGEDPGHRNQYEKLADAFLEGHLYLEYGGEEALAALNNPYDPEEREQAGVWYQWDHAFYDGHYYMYFGVVPVLTTFLPYRVITGEAFTTYRATQWFTLWIVVGLFALFYLLTKRFAPKLPLCVYVVTAGAFSVMSVWYASAEPALYCTAITAAIASMVWSLTLFVKAVYHTKSENAAIAWAAGGALCGALAFGCRPTVALANLLVIPLLITFLREHKLSRKLVFKLVLAALPYVIVAAGLMWYNYVRFDSPFEFGQAYQLTVADQTAYGFAFTKENLVRLYTELTNNLFGSTQLTAEFPYVQHGGVFWNFPVLALAALAFLPSVQTTLRRQKTSGLLTVTAITIAVITVFQTVWTPYLLERYRMDLYFLGALLCFLPTSIWCATDDARARGRRGAVLMVLGAITVVTSALMCLRQIGAYYPEFVGKLPLF